MTQSRNVVIFFFILIFKRRGPNGTPFEFGVFITRLHFPSDYPLSPPKMKFSSEIFHPNSMKKENEFKVEIIDSLTLWFIFFLVYLISLSRW